MNIFSCFHQRCYPVPEHHSLLQILEQISEQLDKLEGFDDCYMELSPSLAHLKFPPPRYFLVKALFTLSNGSNIHYSVIEFTCQCRRYKRCRFSPWVWKIPWRRKWQPTPGILTWKIPWAEEPGRLQSTRPQRVGNWACKPRKDSTCTSCHLNLYKEGVTQFHYASTVHAGSSDSSALFSFHVIWLLGQLTILLSGIRERKYNHIAMLFFKH